MQAFGYQIFVTVLLPGTMVFGSVWLIVVRYFTDTDFYRLLETAFSSDWLAAVLLLLLSSLLGTFLGSVLDWFENVTFDKWTPSNLEIDDKEYWDQWNYFVDVLAKDDNTFVSQMTLYFYFESRTALACILLGGAWICHSGLGPEVLLSVPLFLLSIILWRSAMASHEALGLYRWRN